MNYHICFSEYMCEYVERAYPDNTIIFINEVDFIASSIDAIEEKIYTCLSVISQKQNKFIIWYTEHSFDKVGFILVVDIANKFGIKCIGVNCSFPIIESTRSIRICDSASDLEGVDLSYFYNHKEEIDNNYMLILQPLIEKVKNTTNKNFKFFQSRDYNFYDLLNVTNSLFFWEDNDIIIYSQEELIQIIESANRKKELFIHDFFNQQNIGINSNYCYYLVNNIYKIK